MISITMIDFHHIAFSKGQFAPATFSLLLLEELGKLSPQQWMIFQSLTPVQQISIIWTGLSSDFRVWRENMGHTVLSDGHRLRCRKHPFLIPNLAPVFPASPRPAFVWMSPFGPLNELIIHNVIAFVIHS